VTYWSVHEQRWIERAEYIPDRDLAAMSPQDRARAIRAMEEDR
jgi:hypothetical protein